MDHLSKYCRGQMLLNVSDQMRTDIFSRWHDHCLSVLPGNNRKYIYSAHLGLSITMRWARHVSFLRRSSTMEEVNWLRSGNLISFTVQDQTLTKQTDSFSFRFFSFPKAANFFCSNQFLLHISRSKAIFSRGRLFTRFVLMPVIMMNYLGRHCSGGLWLDCWISYNGEQFGELPAVHRMNLFENRNCNIFTSWSNFSRHGQKSHWVMVLLLIFLILEIRNSCFLYFKTFGRKRD